MCDARCHSAIAAALSRRSFFKRGVAAGVAAGAALSIAGCSPKTPSAQPADEQPAAGLLKKPLTKVVDLSYVLDENFPTFSGKKLFSKKSITKLKKDGYTTYQWQVFEHIGTHIDAPVHFSDSGLTVEKIPAEKLVVPLVVIDISERAKTDSDTQLTPADIEAFELKHGTIGPGSCVAMHSGWEKRVKTPGFRNADAKGTMHFPGFHPEAAELLIERNAAGIAVDTLSLDFGKSKDFGAHVAWLPSNRWGLECLNNLSQLPPTGAMIMVGAPSIAGASGGPSRIFALV